MIWGIGVLIVSLIARPSELPKYNAWEKYLSKIAGYASDIELIKEAKRHTSLPIKERIKEAKQERKEEEEREEKKRYINNNINNLVGREDKSMREEEKGKQKRSTPEEYARTRARFKAKKRVAEGSALARQRREAAEAYDRASGTHEGELKAEAEVRARMNAERRKRGIKEIPPPAYPKK